MSLAISSGLGTYDMKLKWWVILNHHFNRSFIVGFFAYIHERGKTRNLAEIFVILFLVFSQVALIDSQMEYGIWTYKS